MLSGIPAQSPVVRVRRNFLNNFQIVKHCISFILPKYKNFTKFYYFKALRILPGMHQNIARKPSNPFCRDMWDIGMNWMGEAKKKFKIIFNLVFSWGNGL